MTERSCGTVPFTCRDGERLYLLIRKEDGYCSFPKGHIEEGETEEECALRETWEETSLRVKLLPDFRREIRYPLKNGNEKTVVYFLADMGEEAPCHNEGFEEFEYLLLGTEAAEKSLTYESAAELLRAAEAFLDSCPADKA